jgi:hypothetical protein
LRRGTLRPQGETDRPGVPSTTKCTRRAPYCWGDVSPEIDLRHRCRSNGRWLPDQARGTVIVERKASLTDGRSIVGRRYSNTPRAQAEALAQVGRAFAELASEHRGFSSGEARVVNEAANGSSASRFIEWISTLVELTAAAERQLALEVELARKHGVTWQQVGDALGVSRQAASDRFNNHERWNKSRRMSQLNQAKWASGNRRLLQDGTFSEEELAPYRRLRQSRNRDRSRGDT